MFSMFQNALQELENQLMTFEDELTSWADVFSDYHAEIQESFSYLASCQEDLREILERWKLRQAPSKDCSSDLLPPNDDFFNQTVPTFSPMQDSDSGDLRAMDRQDAY